MTIRQLLQHKSGFKKVEGCNTPKDLEKLLEQPLEHKPGTNRAYDNNNYYVARLVLEQIGKVEYTAYVQEHVLRPMGITGMETHFEARQPTCGYGKPGSQRPGFPYNWDCAKFAGPDGWYASIRDLSRFLVGLRDQKVLCPATTKMMYKDLLGWDISYPGWEKNGGWSWDEGNKPNSRGNLTQLAVSFPRRRRRRDVRQLRCRRRSGSHPATSLDGKHAEKIGQATRLPDPRSRGSLFLYSSSRSKRPRRNIAVFQRATYF